MRQAALHIFALTGIAIAQPIYDVFSKHAGFFVAHAARPIDLLAFVAIVSVALPLALLFGQALANSLGARIGAFYSQAIVGVLVAAICLQALGAAGALPADRPWPPVVVAIAIAFAAALAYRRSSAIQRFLALLCLAAPVFPLLFLFASPVRELLLRSDADSPAAVAISKPAPVVVLILDELPLVSLLGDRGEIDAERYPGFARFAADATWFRNATTVAERTALALPALLTGNYPDATKLATLAGYPQNLFTLFADSHLMSVFETNSQLCPESVCAAQLAQANGARSNALLSDASIAAAHVLLPTAWTTGLPTVTQTWRDFGAGEDDATRADPAFPELVRERRFDSPWLHAQFLESFAAGDERTLFFLHLGMPHVPWRYLPSGREYRPAPIFPEGLDPDDRDLWSEDAWAVAQAAQRHLLQVAYADRLVDEMLEALEQVGLYHAAFIAIVSDHGVGLQPGDRRRSLTAGNVAEILPVPLLIKLPNQRAGQVSDRNAQTIDLLPTIADALGFELPFEVDGRSLLREDTSSKKFVLRRLEDKQSYERLEFDTALVAQRLRERADALHEIFPPGPADPTLYAIGPHADLLGSKLSELLVADEYPSVGVTLDAPSRQLEAVELTSAILPVRISGRLESSVSSLENVDLGIALNGALRATTRSTSDAKGAVHFSAILPESTLREGRNTLEIFVLREGGDGIWLEPTWRAGH